jgi:hypothetical protein
VAADVTSADAPRAFASEPAAAAGPAPASRPHRFRFRLIYGGLVVILGAGIAGVVVFAGRSINPSPVWSSWHPKGGGQGAEQEIANHVAQSYRLPNGTQLADIITSPLSVTSNNTTLPIRYIAVRGSKGHQDQITAVSPTNSVMYSLCGLGTACSIATGKPSAERGRLVRREILELALYTFKYVGGVQHVIAFIPQTLNTKSKFVVYLQRNDLGDRLKQPLVTSLGPKVPLPKTIPAGEVRVIDGTTDTRIYSFSGITQAPTGDLVFVLAPITA